MKNYFHGGHNCEAKLDHLASENTALKAAMERLSCPVCGSDVDGNNWKAKAEKLEAELEITKKSRDQFKSEWLRYQIGTPSPENDKTAMSMYEDILTRNTQIVDEMKRLKGALESATVEWRRFEGEYLETVKELAQARDAMKTWESEAIADKAELRRVREYCTHDSECILSQWSQGEPTPDGGYRTMYARKWYQTKPIDETPKCTCGLNEAFHAMRGDADD